MLAVIGLGNPGSRYARTRHNAGFMALDWLARQHRVPWHNHPLTASETARIQLGGVEVWLAKPQTFMNRCGISARALQAHLSSPPEEMLIVLDDFLLDLGRLRFRRRGSDGGHNGLASVIAALETEEVPRLRLGIGQPDPGESSIDYVLSDFAPDEDAEAVARNGAAAIEYYAEAGIEAAMNRYNGLQSSGTQPAGPCQQTSR